MSRQGERHRKASVSANLHRVKSLNIFERIDEGGTGIFLIGKHIASDRHTGEAVNGVRMLCKSFHIGIEAFNEFLVLLNLFGEITEQIVLQAVLLTLTKSSGSPLSTR